MFRNDACYDGTHIYDGKTELSEREIRDITGKVLELIKKELPKEARCIYAIHDILDEAKKAAMLLKV